MGLNVDTAEFLAVAWHNGVRFDNTVTLGRQNLYISRSELWDIARRYFLPSITPTEYAEPFFVSLGAQKVHSIDASPFEGASIIHDLNFPVPSEYHEAFDAVCDFGTLEHVYRFPVGLFNAMKMVRVGGHLIIVTPANNLFGHGLYQFGPEIFYRTLTRDRGFKINTMLLIEYGIFKRVYEIHDPSRVGMMSTTITKHPAFLVLCAQRVDKCITDQAIYQGQHDAQWKGRATVAQVKPVDGLSGVAHIGHRLLEVAPRFARFLERLRCSRWNALYTLQNKKLYTRVNSLANVWQ